jgi:hypothetical protein
VSSNRFTGELPVLGLSLATIDLKDNRFTGPLSVASIKLNTLLSFLYAAVLTVMRLWTGLK